MNQVADPFNLAVMLSLGDRNSILYYSLETDFLVSLLTEKGSFIKLLPEVPIQVVFCSLDKA